jgi:bifunctional DNase/RNase
MIGRLAARSRSMPVAMELSRIVIIEMQEHQVIVLKEVNGERSFPIVIGKNEADAINRRLNGYAPPRPMTHDLLANSIEALGGKLEAIEINNLQEHTFFARLHIRQNDTVLKIDSRPSDAIALGVVGNVPILVADHVLKEAGV